jgi:uncharacterized protein YdiU (UPF0061 family)
MLKLSYDMNISQMQLKQMFIAGLHNATHFQAHLSANIHTFIDLKDLAAAAQRYARAYKNTKLPSKPFSNTNRMPPKKVPSKPKTTNEVDMDGEMNEQELYHAQLEELYN